MAREDIWLLRHLAPTLKLHKVWLHFNPPPLLRPSTCERLQGYTPTHMHTFRDSHMYSLHIYSINTQVHNSHWNPYTERSVLSLRRVLLYGRQHPGHKSPWTGEEGDCLFIIRALKHQKRSYGERSSLTICPVHSVLSRCFWSTWWISAECVEINVICFCFLSTFPCLFLLWQD